MIGLTPPSSSSATMKAGLPIRMWLPCGGWRVGFLAWPDGRTAVEVTDLSGSVAYLVAGTGSPVVSIEAGWAGNGGQWWALAIGRVPAEADRPSVIFTRGTRRARRTPPQAVDGLWVVHDGLWIAAVTGRYTHVRLTAGATTRMRRLRLVTDPRG
jgi:hypothetical protein